MMGEGSLSLSRKGKCKSKCISRCLALEKSTKSTCTPTCFGEFLIKPGGDILGRQLVDTCAYTSLDVHISMARDEVGTIYAYAEDGVGAEVYIFSTPDDLHICITSPSPTNTCYSFEMETKENDEQRSITQQCQL